MARLLLALHLGKAEGGDLEVLVLAGILHDTARWEQQLTGLCHATLGAENAWKITLYSEDGEFPPEDTPEYSPVAEYDWKLKNIADQMLTRTGKAMARKRHDFMKQFFCQLKAEVNGQM